MESMTKRNAFQFRRANEEDLPEICRIVKLAGESVPVKEWFEAEDEEFLAKHIREEGFTLLAKKNGQIAAIMIVRIPGLAEDNLGEYLKISRGRNEAGCASGDCCCSTGVSGIRTAI